MTRLLEIALILAIILMAAHFVQLDKEFDCVVSSREFQELRVKHGLKNTEIVVNEHGRDWYYNDRGKLCRFK